MSSSSAASSRRSPALGQDDLRDFFKLTKADPIVSKSRVPKIDERVDFRSNVLCPLDPQQVRATVRSLLDQGWRPLRSVRIRLQEPYPRTRRPRHRPRDDARCPGQDLQRHLPAGLRIGANRRRSGHLLRHPKVKDYLDGINRGLKGHGYQHDPLIMQSFGGIGLPEVIKKRAVSCIASGSVAGVIGARTLGETLGYDNMLCTDIGGAGFDVGMIGFMGVTEVPIGMGAAGGYPAGNHRDPVIRDFNALELLSKGITFSSIAEVIAYARDKGCTLRPAARPTATSRPVVTKPAEVPFAPSGWAEDEAMHSDQRIPGDRRRRHRSVTRCARCGHIYGAADRYVKELATSKVGLPAGPAA